MLIIRFVLYYCPQDLAFQFRFWLVSIISLVIILWWQHALHICTDDDDDTCYQQNLPSTDRPLLDQGTLLPQESPGRDEACRPCASRQFSGSTLSYIWTVTSSLCHIIRSIILLQYQITSRIERFSNFILQIIPKSVLIFAQISYSWLLVPWQARLGVG